MREASAFTLVEAIVGVVLTCITFGVLWGLFFYDNKRITASMERLTALRGGEQIVESLRSDLRNLVQPKPDEYAAWGNRPVLLETADPAGGADGYEKITMRRYQRGTDPTSPLQVVGYRLDAASGRVMRTVDGKDTPIGATQVRDFVLGYQRQGASECVTYEVIVAFLGVSRLGDPGGNVKLLTFQGQIDLIDKAAAADRFRWVPTGAESR